MYSAENYQLSLAHTPTPDGYACRDPREAPGTAAVNSIGYVVPPSPDYSSCVATMDPPTSRRRKRGQLPRRDLASSGVHKFSDKPGREYLLWKHLFRNILINDGGLRPAEELKQMIAWLGPASAEVVRDIYSAQLGNPVTALSRSWDLLDQRYGASTLTESSLLDRINDFPDISLSEPRASVCGDSPSRRSCHWISLAKVYPEGRPEEAVKMYVIVGTQSNQSLARSAFFDLF
ncbi:uncharacterized protein LOC132709811 [Pantherophis guttatus]|uniref:Uncharacterized protein LOC132709811 n=1 Tax=Pantherophis guttatus TaxID=94885 RepID=A0ABM3YX29_PANGU|nr:uncharacterized protein LOC132709811 [Pantherophis guttatus]XP_060540674.1 uncharacterized protein LOC132709811 [Pantherophis guttatus]XP_060540675.1 uncharacterized protein LOC132709811 [Pantherophis guttatus]